MPHRKHKNQGGFTLIELLVVISIISLLASIIIVATNGARQKARVAKRVGDLSQIAKALELYYSDNNSYPNSGYGGPPPPPAWWRSQCAWTGNAYMAGNSSSTQVVWDTTLSKGLVPTYISSFPADPIMNAPNTQNCYSYASNGTDYKLMDWGITDMTLAQIHQYPTFIDPPRNDTGVTGCIADPTPSLAVYTSGAKCW